MPAPIHNDHRLPIETSLACLLSSARIGPHRIGLPLPRSSTQAISASLGYGGCQGSCRMSVSCGDAAFGLDAVCVEGIEADHFRSSPRTDGTGPPAVRVLRLREGVEGPACVQDGVVDSVVAL